jgi:hypothetical protein
MIGLGEAWRAAEDYVRRNTKSKAVREAEKRRQERRLQQAWRQTKQAGAVGGVSGVGAFGYAVTVAPVASAAIAGGAVAIAAVALVQFWRTRAGASSGFSSDELTQLPPVAEDWLLDRRQLLPFEAWPAVDSILTHLAELPPHLARLPAHSTLAWESRRLIGDHLTGLIASWCELPAATRQGDTDLRRRLVSALRTIAGELEKLGREVSRDQAMAIETRSRFLDSRYRDPHLGES